MNSVLIKSVMLNHGLDFPYLPRWVEHRLYRSTEPVEGKTYYTECGYFPVSKTWLTDEEAEDLIKSWNKRAKVNS